MFKISGNAIFSESDMTLGEQLEQTLKNEGFYVKKEYKIKSPAELHLFFNVETREDQKPDTIFKMN